MSENTSNEKIVVSVDGQQAQQGFQGIGAAARQADASITQLGQTINNAQVLLNRFGATAAGWTRQAQQAAQAGQQAAQGVRAAGNAAGNAGQQAQSATNHFNALQQSLFGVRGKAAFLWDLAIDGFKSAIGFAESFIERTSAIQRTMSLLATIPGSNSGAEFEYLFQTANNYGLSLRSIQDDYAKLHLAAQNTQLSTDGVRRLFEQTAMATRTLHLNTQQTQLTFLALEQMLSKGKLSMEELRKQFSERIPGAMQAFARELGVPYAVLEKFITKVGAASDKIIPELGNAIQRMYQSAIPVASRALDAELNRIQSSITMFFKKVVDAGGAEGMAELLRTVNGLLQTDTIAKVFANAMNLITGRLTEFLRTLQPQDIERFATVALDFLASLARLAVAAAQAVQLLANNLPALGAAFGGFMGATALAPLGPWGAAIGLALGALAGYGTGSAISNSSMGMTSMQANLAQVAELEKSIKYFTNQRDRVLAGEKGVGDSVEGWERKIQEARALQGTILQSLPKLSKRQLETMGPTVALPELGPLRDMITDPEKAMTELTKRYGLSGGEETEAQKKARLAKERQDRLVRERQDRFVDDLLARVLQMRDPEAYQFQSIETNMAQAGIVSGHPRYLEARNLLVELQADFNRRKQDESNKKTFEKEQNFKQNMESAFADSMRFHERYTLENLNQIDDSDWAAKARRMANQLDVELIQQRKRWQKMMDEDPLFAITFDLEGELEQIRTWGQAYIDEFKRIEAEKRSITGGEKEFLKEWHENATNFGKITYDFLKGTTDGMVDMLFNLVRHGEFSFAKLTQFVLDYIIKMMIVQAITPFMNSIVGSITQGFGQILGGAQSSIQSASSMYSFSSLGGLGLQARANGGPVWPGQPFLVGERGPEIVTFSSQGYVHPNHSISGGGDVYVNVTVHNDGSMDTDTTGPSNLGRRLGDAVRAIIIDEKRPGGILSYG